MVKFFLLKAYIAIHKFDIICTSETYLDSSTPSDDSNLEISGYTLVRSIPLTIKEGGGSIYYKSFVPLRIPNVEYLLESICFELKIGDKTFYLYTNIRAKVEITLKPLLKTLN